MSLINLILGIKRIAAVDIVVLCLDEDMQNFFGRMTGVATAVLPDPLKIMGKVLIWGVSPLAWSTLKLLLYEVVRLPFSIWKQWKLFRKLRPDLIHLNSSVLFTSAIAARLAGIQVIWHVREVLAGGRFSVRRWFAGWLIRTLAHRIIAISPVEVLHLGPDGQGKVRVVYNSIELSHFTASAPVRNETRRALGFAPTHKVIVSLGGVSHWKGTVELIEAMSFTEVDTQLIFLGPPIAESNFVIRGRIRLTLWLEDLLVRFGIQRFRLMHYAERVSMALATAPRDRIHFLGSKDNVVPFLNAADVLVFAGMAPHFPRPVFEAWALKKPVVVFDMPGITEHVEDGVDCIVVKEKSGSALGHAITHLLNDREQMEQIGERGYLKTMAFFDQVNNSQSVFSIYQDIIPISSVQQQNA